MKHMLDSIVRTIQREWMTLLFIAAIAAVWLLLRTQSSGAASVEEFDRKIRAGRPVVVEFFANT
jgi:hypothetical protein